ncbi:MAG: hypothetical protein R3E08_01850 [Thiotrichaceae bacterium]
MGNGCWQQMLANPDKQLKKFNYPHEATACDVLLQGIQQLAIKNAPVAYNYLKKLGPDYQCPATAQNDTCYAPLPCKPSNKNTPKL